MVKDLILICSERFDASTNFIIHWLKYYGERFVRINFEDTLAISSINIENDRSDIDLLVNENIVRISDLKSFWYRRGKARIRKDPNLGSTISDLSDDENVNKGIGKHVNEELDTINDFLYYILEGTRIRIGKYSNSNNNKLIHLEIAKNVGFKIPATLISSNREAFEVFTKKYDFKITKAVSNGLMLMSGNDSKAYVSYTEDLTDAFISSLPNRFFPLLTQQKISKTFELRVFYLHGQVFPMAIFSQNDPQTRTDFRKYNDLKPNRTTPFKLPEEIVLKINNFMTAVNLDTGSLDILYIAGEYYFLEVNPVGQFGMVSRPCNFYIERAIANILSDRLIND